MGFVPNPNNEPTDKGYVNVLDPSTNQVMAFPETMSSDDISRAISDDKNGTVSTPKPNWYNDNVRPALEATGMDMFQPKFLGAKVDADATRAFVTSYAKDASFGAIDNKNPEVAAINQQAQAAHPIASFTGSLAGQTQALLTTAGLGDFFGLGKAAGAVTKVAGKTAGGATAGAGVGALYGAITKSVDEINNSIENNTHPDLVKIGEASLKDAGIFSLYGVAGGLSSVPIATAAISGAAYTVSKLEGADEKDALLNAAVMGIFHSVNSSLQTKETLAQHQDALDQVKADYIKAKNPIIHDAIVDRTAEEHTMDMKDQVTQDLRDKYMQKTADFKNSEAKLAVSNAPEEIRAQQQKDLNNEMAIFQAETPNPDSAEAQNYIDEQTINKQVQEIVGGTSAGKSMVADEKTQTNTAVGKITKVSSDINKTLVSKGFEELPAEEQAKYTPITKEQQLSKVSKLIAKDYEKAKRMATGQERIPNDINSQVIFNAVKNKAIADMDVETIRSLAASPVATERSEAAQKLSASGFDNGLSEGDPIAAINNVAKARTKAVEKSLGKEKVAKEKKTEVANIKKSIKEKVKKQDWNGFIKSLEC